MAGVTLEIDPEAAVLALTGENGYKVLAPIKSPATQTARQWASNADSEGDHPAGGRPQNIEITVPLRITSPAEDGDEAAFREAQVKLEEKIGKLVDEGGTLRVVYPDGSYIDWEIRDVTGGERLIDNRFVHSQRTQDELTFVCAPYGEGPEELLGEFEGEAKRALECIVEVGGSAEALARAVITSPEADLWELKWGKESRSLSEAPTAKSLYAAPELTPMGGASVTNVTVDGKAATPVVRQSLTPNWTAMLSTQFAAGGRMTHVGIFEVLVWVHMPTTNTGEIGVAFEYGVGDMANPTELEGTYFPADHAREGRVVQLSVGQIFLDPVGRGNHQWEGRVIAMSSVVGDKLDILDVDFRPLAEGNGSVRIDPALNQPAALLTRDEFLQAGATLNGKILSAATSVAGALYAGAAVEVPGAELSEWIGVGSTKGPPDENIAQCTIGFGFVSSRFIQLSTYGFAIPEGATIRGISIAVTRFGPNVADYSIKIGKAGVAVGTDHASAASWASGGTATYGGPEDLWGTTWTPAQINAAGFGVFIAARSFIPGGGGSSAHVDSAGITVYYTPAAAQTWETVGDPADFGLDEVAQVAKRTEVSDADINTGRYAVAGTTVTSDVVVGIKAKRGAATIGASERIRGSAMARFESTNAWVMASVDIDASASPAKDTVRVFKRVAGTVTELAKATISESIDYRSLWLKVDRRGRFFVWGVLVPSGAPRLLLAGQDNDLATGGALDDGKNGFSDAKTGAAANTRVYDQFVVWVPSLDAVIYQGRSLELSHDGARREVQGGGDWTDVTPHGDYLRLSPKGMEGRKNRLVLIPSAHDPELMGVGFPTKLKVAIYAKRRYRTIPDPA